MTVSATHPRVRELADCVPAAQWEFSAVLCRARPKSGILAHPSGVTRTLPGPRSRCTAGAACRSAVR